METNLGMIFGFIFPLVTIVAVFTFVAIASWSDNRRKERETFYRHETYAKILEHSGESSRTVLELMRQEDALRARRRIEGLRLGGLITTAVGAGMMVFLYALVPEKVFWVGLIPLLVGIVLTTHAFLLRPQGPPPA